MAPAIDVAKPFPSGPHRQSSLSAQDFAQEYEYKLQVSCSLDLPIVYSPTYHGANLTRFPTQQLSEGKAPVPRFTNQLGFSINCDKPTYCTHCSKA